MRATRSTDAKNCSARFDPPRPADGLALRSKVLEQLSGPTVKVAVITAPAGYGKTSHCHGVRRARPTSRRVDRCRDEARRRTVAAHRPRGRALPRHRLRPSRARSGGRRVGGVLDDHRARSGTRRPPLFGAIRARARRRASPDRPRRERPDHRADLERPGRLEGAARRALVPAGRPLPLARRLDGRRGRPRRARVGTRRRRPRARRHGCGRRRCRDRRRHNSDRGLAGRRPARRPLVARRRSTTGDARTRGRRARLERSRVHGARVAVGTRRRRSRLPHAGERARLAVGAARARRCPTATTPARCSTDLWQRATARDPTRSPRERIPDARRCCRMPSLPSSSGPTRGAARSLTNGRARASRATGDADRAIRHAIAAQRRRSSRASRRRAHAVRATRTVCYTTIGRWIECVPARSGAAQPGALSERRPRRPRPRRRRRRCRSGCGSAARRSDPRPIRIRCPGCACSISGRRPTPARRGRPWTTRRPRTVVCRPASGTPPRASRTGSGRGRSATTTPSRCSPKEPRRRGCSVPPPSKPTAQRCWR